MDDSSGWDLLAVTTAAFFVTMAARLALSPLVPEIMNEFSVTKSSVGLALSGMWATYALFQFPGGILADRLGHRRTIMLAITATGLMSIVLAMAPTFPFFVLFAVVLGAGAGLYFTAATAFLTAQFDNVGWTLGVHEIGASLAGLIAPLASAYAAAQLDWRAGPLVPAAITFVVLGLFAWRAPRTAPSTANEEFIDQLNPQRLLKLLSRPSILLTTVLAMIAFFTWQAFASFFPTFLIEYLHISTGRASLIFGSIFVLTIVGAPALGWVSDLVNRDMVLAASLLAGVVGYLLFLFSDGVVTILIGGLLVSVGLSWPGVLSSRFMDHLSTDERGAGFGLIRTIMLLVSSLGSVVIGTIADQASWLAAYGFVAVLLGLLVVMLGTNWFLDVGA